MSILKKYILIIEDHPGSFNEMVKAIQEIRPEAEIIHAETANQAKDYINSYHDKLELVSIDLGLPDENVEYRAKSSNGIDLLRTLLKERSTLNLVVNTGQDPKLLSGLKSSILEHRGGFVFLYKSALLELMVQKLQIAMSGNIDYRFIKSELGDFSMKPVMLKALQLAANGHDNSQIAEETYMSTRNVDYKLRDAGAVLGIYADDPGNFRVRVINAGREAGIIV